MKKVAESLEQLVCSFCERYKSLTEELTAVKPAESKWTLKEIIGHLIDSAANNHQRITRLQLMDELHFPSYENEKWLAVEKWNSFRWLEILSLFLYYNLFLVHLIRNTDPDCLKNRWFGQNRNGDCLFTLEELINDYLRHFKEHLEHFETRLKEIRSGS